MVAMEMCIQTLLTTWIYMSSSAGTLGGVEKMRGLPDISSQVWHALSHGGNMQVVFQYHKLLAEIAYYNFGG